MKFDAPIDNPVTGKPMQSAIAAHIVCACGAALGTVRYATSPAIGASRIQLSRRVQPADRSLTVMSASIVSATSVDREAWCRAHGSKAISTAGVLAAVEAHRSDGTVTRLVAGT